MADTTITSANSVFLISSPSLFPAPVQLVGYASDKAFAMDALDIAEVNMGVDGRMTAGFVPNPSKQTVTLQADSPSISIFETIIRTMKQAREVFYLNASIAIPSTGESYTLTRGILTSISQMPNAQKILQEREFSITWQTVTRSLI